MKVRKNILEWTVFGAGTILILILLGVLGREAVESEGDEPQLDAAFSSPEARGEFTHYTMTVRNSGNATANEVEVVVGLVQGQSVVERATATFAFVPRRSEREAQVLFRVPGSAAARPVAISVTYQKD